MTEADETQPDWQAEDPEFWGLTPELAERLSPTERARYRDWERGHVQPCVALVSERVDRTSWLGRKLGKTRQAVLPLDVSKLGGCPYLTSMAEWPRIDGREAEFLGQVNFAELSPPVPPLPERGVLGLFLAPRWSAERPPIHVVWHPQVALDRAVETPATPRYPECKVVLRLGWDVPLPDFDTFSAWLDDPETEKRDAILARLQRLEDVQGLGGHHQLLPVPSDLLAEVVASDPADLVPLVRLEYDNTAGMAWGTNTFYVVVERQDLADGRLERARSIVLNA